MLVTDVGDEMCWWQLLDVELRSSRSTIFLHWRHHHSKDVSNIDKPLPTWSHQHREVTVDQTRIFKVTLVDYFDGESPRRQNMILSPTFLTCHQLWVINITVASPKIYTRPDFDTNTEILWLGPARDRPVHDGYWFLLIRIFSAQTGLKNHGPNTDQS